MDEINGARIGGGDVTITLGGQEVVLRATIGAALAISALGGERGFSAVVERVALFDLATIIRVVEIGIGQRSKDLPELIWSEGLNVMAPKAIEFLNALVNGGRSAKVAAEGDGEQAARPPVTN